MADLNYRYATALFDLALKNGKLDEFYDQAVFLRNALGDAECQQIITHPHISSKEKHDFFGSIFKDNIHDDLLGFLYLVVDKNRENYLLSSLTSFVNMTKSYKNQATAYVTSAVLLNEKQLASLTSMLSKKTGKQVEVITRVDPSLIGGLYIYVDGYLIDQTIKKQLKEMKNNLG